MTLLLYALIALMWAYLILALLMMALGAVLDGVDRLWRWWTE
jgi:hypothetical protein